jgi:kinesin family protein 14
MSNPTPIGKRVHFNSNNDTPQATIAAKRAALSNGTTPRLQGIRTSFSTDQTLNSSTTSALSSSLSNNENNLITVAVRVRPLNNKETSHGYYDAIKVLNLNEILLNDIPGNKQHRFRCDHIITDQASANSKNACDDQQQYVYESIGKSMLDKAFDGYNASIFAYGQTGSGKTYSMIGTNDEPGLIPRFFDNLFKQKAERDEIVSSSHVEMSYYEIYNEKIYDLLRSTDKTKTPASITGRNLQIRENPQTGPYIVDLLTLSANSADDAKLWLNIGNKRRATASTAMNQKSSRSHSVFQLTLTQMVEHKDKNGLLQLVTSRINLVDLAGSERISNTLTSASPSQPRFKESTCINKSLLTLGKIICLLSERQSSNMGYLPYRESVLTWLLKESLGGNSKTTMLATVNASSLYIDETLCTLRYAAKTACIKNIAHLNCNFKQKIIDKFGQEMEINTIPKNFEMSLKLMEEEWKRKLEETAILKQKEIKELKDSLIVLYENETRAQNCCLINLNEDPSLSEKLIYLLKALNDEETLIGSDNDQVNIHLTGTLIAPIHAKITKRSDNYYIKQVDFNHVTYLNGEVINNHDELQLNHGDRIIFGGSHYFRFNNPLNKQQSANTINHFKDYQFARNEIEQKQNELTQRRLDEEMWKHKMDSDLKLNELKEIYEKKIESIKNDSEKEKTAYKMELEEVKNKSSKKIKQIVEQKLLIESQLSKLNSNQMEINNEVAKEERILRTPCASVSTRLRLYSEQKVNQSASIENQELILNHANSGGLFAITLRINEANKICAILGFEYEFKRYDFIDSQKSKLAQNLKQQLANSKCISVIDKRLGLITLWNLETFDDKLDMLRDTYNKYLEVDSQSASFVSSNVSVNDSQLITDTMDEWQTLDAYTKNGEQFSPRMFGPFFLFEFILYFIIIFDEYFYHIQRVENAVGTSHTEKKSCKRRLSILTNSPSIVHNGNQSSSKHFGSMDCLSSNGDIDTDMVDNLPNESNNALIKRNCLNELSQQTPVNNTNNNNNNNNKSNFQRTPFISASISNLNKCKSTDLPKSAHTLSHLSSNHELDKQLKMCNAFVYATCRDALNENIQSKLSNLTVYLILTSID